MSTDDQLSGGKFTISLNGSDLPDELFQAIEKVVVEDEINLPTMFTLRFNIESYAEGDFKGIDLETFKIGDEVKILMGMDTTEEMMTGEITALEPTFGEQSFMEIRGFDRLHRLRFGTHRRSFLEMKDSDIASDIASEAGLTPQVEDTGTTHKYLFQNNQSNFGFLSMRAARLNYEIMANNKNFIFRVSQEDKEPEISMEYGIDLERFTATLRAITEGSEVEVRGWDVQKKEEITYTIASGSETTKMGGDESGFEISEALSASSIAIVDNTVVDTQDAENLGKAKYNAMIKQFISGEGRVVAGNPLVRAGKTVEILGVGERFSGIYYVNSTVHIVGVDDAYQTIFKVRRTGI